MLSAHPALQGARVALLFAGLLALSSGAAAAAGSAAPADDGVRPRAIDARLRVADKALIRKGDADSLEAAALLAASASERLARAGRAAARAPDRPDIAWLNLQLCSHVPSCDQEPLEARLRTLDSGNAAAWSLAVVRAHQRDDAVAERAALHAMAAAQRFDVYWNTIIVHATDAVLGTGALDPQAALTIVIGTAAALTLPPLGRVARVCREQAAADVAVRTDCERISAAMRSGDSYVIESLGASIARTLWPEGSADRQAADSEHRTVRYQLEQSGQLEQSVALPSSRLQSAGDARGLLQALRTHRTEQEATVAELAAAGLEPTPPPGWTEPDAAAR